MISVQDFLNRYQNHHRLHIKRLMEDYLHLSPEFLMAHPDHLLSDLDVTRLEDKVKRLLQEVPLSRLLGYREFWSLKFYLSDATLDPRQDSETMIETILKYRPLTEEPLRIVDLGTGTGCLIISLLTEYPYASGVAVDISKEALTTAQKNAQLHHVEDRLAFHEGSWLEGLTGLFDIIVSNPPYISENDYQYLDAAVKNHDPLRALIPGKSGLEAYEEIIPSAKSFLKPHGLLVLEIGSTQAGNVLELLQTHNFHHPKVYQDLSGKDRCVVGVKN